MATQDPISDGLITASATDIFGQVGVAPAIHVTVTVPSGLGNAMASLDSVTGSSGPQTLTTNLNIIRDGRFQLSGRAYQTMGSNVTWQVGIYGIDGTFIRNVSPVMTNTVGSATVSSNLLTCDLTTLMNGVYDLRLTVSGGYTEAETNVEIQVETNLKIGQFSFSQQDLIIPVSGIPLTVTRTYNSINPERGDFGFGWTYALADMNASIDETRTDTNDLDGEAFSERTGGSWDVTLTLPNGQVTTFAFTLVPGVFGSYDAEWVSAPGVTAKLDVLPGANKQLDVLIGSVLNNPAFYYWHDAGIGTPMENYDFPGFVLTTLDGTKYTLTRDDLGDHFMDDGMVDGAYRQAYGDLHLTKIEIPAHDKIDISANAIVYTATNGATRQVVFQRNDDNLITSVSDPDGLTGVTNGYPFAKYEYDAQDNLMNVQNLVDRSAGAYVTNFFTYTNVNFPHYITGIINANGTQVAKNFYDDTGKLTAVQDANGNLTRFIHDLNDNIEATVDRDGFTNTFVYDLRGNVILQTNQAGEITRMGYDVFNNKTNEVTYLAGVPYATNSYRYDTNLEEILVATDALGHTNASTYDTNGRVTSSIDGRGDLTTNFYDGNGNLIATVDALTNTTRYAYVGSEMVGMVDAIRTLTTNYYDPSTGYLLAMATIDASSAILSSNTYVYDANGNQTNSTSWRRVSGSWVGAVTTTVYDGMNRVVQTIAPDGGVSTTVYDPIGKTIATIDPLGRTNQYVYDALGRQIIMVYADGTATTNVYDADGRVTNRLDQAGNATTNVYDALGRQVETIYADGATNATVYDGVGRVAESIDARGNITAYGYDAAGRRLSVTNGLGSPVQMVTTNSYDANGNQVTMTDGNLHTTTSVYDALNRQVQTLYADGSASEVVYDVGGRKVAETNQDAVVTLYGYDGSGRLTSVTNAVNAAEVMVTQYQYDEAGNETAQIDGLNRTNLYKYDVLNRRIWHGMPTNSLVERFSYDLAGNLVLQTNFNGAVITNQYDAMNRLTNRASIGGYSVTFRYTATGQRSSMSDLSGYTWYQYDNRQRLTYKEDDITNMVGLVLRYTYDANGNLTRLDDGEYLDYQYDALNRLVTMNSSECAYSYDGAGNLQRMTCNGNSLTNLYQYDALNRLTNLVWMTNGNLAASFAYKTKASGARTNAAEMINGMSHTDYWNYDHLYRLTGETITGLGTNGYAYDTVGNRLSRQSNVLPPATYGYNANDRLTNDVYDSNGNTTTNAGGTNYVYDVMNELVSANGGQVQYWYNGDGERVKKMVGTMTTEYSVDDRNPSGYAQVMVEDTYPAAGSRTSEFLYDYGLALVSFSGNSGIFYYGTDGHGSVRFLAQTGGTITDTYWYDAFGTMISRTGTTANNYLYCAQQFDPDLGMYYNRARYLNTDTGRFWSSDSEDGDNEGPLSLHKYVYTEDNPICGIDPSGNGIEDVDILTGALGGAYLNYLVVGSKIALENGTRAIGQETLKIDGALDDFQYGLYYNLRAKLAGTGRQAHHIYEVRFWKQLGFANEQQDRERSMCVALTYAQHVYITQAIRQIIGYDSSFAKTTTSTAKRKKVLDAHLEVYKDAGVDTEWLPRAAKTIPILNK